MALPQPSIVVISVELRMVRTFLVVAPVEPRGRWIESGVKRAPYYAGAKNGRMPATAAACVLPLTLIVIWDLAVRFEYVPDTILATPVETAQAFARLIASGVLLKHIIVSTTRLVLG